jgi:outer membrane lipoprotein-sorting protein
MTLTRRSLLALLPLAAIPWPALAAATISADDQALVDRAVGYLQGLANAKGRFKQTDWRGAVAAGTLYVARPGKARFEYDPPAGLVIVSDGKTVTVVDTRLKTTRRYPLNSTPLGLFLAKQIRLDRGVRLLGVAHVYDGFTISAADAHGQAQGEISLNFAETPLRLAGWTITDPQKRATNVELMGFGPVAELSPSLFALAPSA